MFAGHRVTRPGAAKGSLTNLCDSSGPIAGAVQRSVLIGWAALLGLCGTAAIASPGDLDVTFGNLGLAHLPVAIGQPIAIQGVLLPSGAALVNVSGKVVRIDASGAIDQTFGEN